MLTVASAEDEMPQEASKLLGSEPGRGYELVARIAIPVYRFPSSTLLHIIRVNISLPGSLVSRAVALRYFLYLG